MNDARALQILNNVSEEFADHGDTNFATKKELCEAIQWLQNDTTKHLQRKDSALSRIVTLAAEAAVYSKP